ncbi:hypothetical protein TanjilG_30114 [Lupinus angustifolius]|uniref:Auxin-responsive protein n=1 Tax=Lupinus angustifolius TaxID=3871 RepID=A0A4P1R6U0_LUPAN|nr:hypothetical protein TanjilG_30114 [Lupinus angustifolius]
MSPESSTYSSESDAVDFNLKETELTLGPPGIKTGNKRSFFDTVDLHLATPTHNNSANSSNNFLCSTTKSQTPKMFVESCKRIRLMISSETIGLGTMSGSKCKGAQVKRINGTMISC